MIIIGCEVGIEAVFRHSLRPKQIRGKVINTDLTDWLFIFSSNGYTVVWPYPVKARSNLNLMEGHRPPADG